MGSQGFIQAIVDGIVIFATNLLLPTMVFGFVLAVIMRGLIYYTIKRELWFAKEFEKRVDQKIEEEEEKGENGEFSFFVLAKQVLEKTYYELFIVRSIMKRRRPDFVVSGTDRVFLIQTGCARLVKDMLKKIKHLKHEGPQPKFKDVTRNVFENNPCFSKVFGIMPASVFNDVLSILPGIFIIGGIFGTFLGIMKALPELGNMDLSDIEGSKAVMDSFLLKLSFAMSTSIVGIILSVLMTILNTMLSPDKVFINTIDRFENSIDTLWNRSRTNLLPEEIPDFDEHKDPMDALAEQAVEQEVAKSDEKRTMKKAV